MHRLGARRLTMYNKILVKQVPVMKCFIGAKMFGLLLCVLALTFRSAVFVCAYAGDTCIVCLVDIVYIRMHKACGLTLVRVAGRGRRPRSAFFLTFSRS